MKHKNAKELIESLLEENYQLQRIIDVLCDNEREARELANKHLKNKCKLELDNAHYFNQCHELNEQRLQLKKENELLKIKNEYLTKVIKMSENIEIHSDAEDKSKEDE